MSDNNKMSKNLFLRHMKQWVDETKFIISGGSSEYIHGLTSYDKVFAQKVTNVVTACRDLQDYVKSRTEQQP